MTAGKRKPGLERRKNVRTQVCAREINKSLFLSASRVSDLVLHLVQCCQTKSADLANVTENVGSVILERTTDIEHLVKQDKVSLKGIWKASSAS